MDAPLLKKMLFLSLALLLVIWNSKDKNEVNPYTLMCGIIMPHILLIFDFFPCLQALLNRNCTFINFAGKFLPAHLFGTKNSLSQGTICQLYLI